MPCVDLVPIQCLDKMGWQIMKILPLSLLIYSCFLGSFACAQEAKPPVDNATPSTTATKPAPAASDLARINALSEQLATQRQTLNQAINELNQKQEELQQSIDTLNQSKTPSNPGHPPFERLQQSTEAAKQDRKIYKWVDANGKVQYSEIKPNNITAETINITPPPSLPAADSMALAEPRNAIADESRAIHEPRYPNHQPITASRRSESDDLLPPSSSAEDEDSAYASSYDHSSSSSDHRYYGSGYPYSSPPPPPPLLLPPPPPPPPRDEPPRPSLESQQPPPPPRPNLPTFNPKPVGAGR